MFVFVGSRERESQPFSSQVTTANEKETVLICTSKSKNRFCQSKVSPFEHEKKLLLLFENVSIYWIPSSLPNRSHPPLSFPWRTKINRPFAPTTTMDFPKKDGFFRKRRRHFFPLPIWETDNMWRSPKLINGLLFQRAQKADIVPKRKEIYIRGMMRYIFLKKGRIVQQQSLLIAHQWSKTR